MCSSDLCNLLVHTIRKNGDTRPVSLLINPEDEEYARSFECYDQFAHFTPNDKVWGDCHTAFEKYCLYPRLKFPEYLVYDETIITDTDMLCQYNTEHVWSYMSNQSHPIKMLGRWIDPSWHWGSINDVIRAYGKHVPHTHGGFFYLRKNTFLKTFFDYCEEVFYKYDEYKCKRAFRGGKVDEIIFAIAHSKFNLLPMQFDEFPVMSFNYTPNMEIPNKMQTADGQNIMLNGYPSFVHMFDKMDGENFKSLYSRIMNG